MVSVFYFLFLITSFRPLLSIRPAFNNWAFIAVLGVFSGARLLALRPTPPTWRARVSLFVWLLPFDLSGLGDPTSSYATAGTALRVAEARKLPHHVKVETPSGGRNILSGCRNKRSIASVTNNFRLKPDKSNGQYIYTKDLCAHSERKMINKGIVIKSIHQQMHSWLNLTKLQISTSKITFNRSYVFRSTTITREPSLEPS